MQQSDQRLNVGLGESLAEAIMMQPSCTALEVFPDTHDDWRYCLFTEVIVLVGSNPHTIVLFFCHATGGSMGLIFHTSLGPLGVSYKLR